MDRWFCRQIYRIGRFINICLGGIERFFKNFGSGQTLTATAAQEISGHELGHATSIINGAESAGTTYSIYAQNNFLQFDYTFVDSNHATSTPRAACSAGGTKPFDNISAESDGQPICNAGV